MRKIFALMLAIAMVLTMVACGKKADNKADSMVTPELYISTVDGKDTVVDKDGKAVTGYTVHQYISQKRLLRAKVEFQTAHTYDYFVINDTVEEAVRELDAIITAEHCKPKERMAILGE